jgi:hypothetical protein
MFSYLARESTPQTQVLYPDDPQFETLLPEPQYEYVTWENATYRLTVENRGVEQEGRRIRRFRR